MYYDESLNAFISIFDPIPDIRQQGKIKHILSEIIFIAIVGTVAGADDWEEIEDFAIEKEDWLRKYLVLENGIPSHDTIERCFAWMDPKVFLNCFMEWVRMISKLMRDEKQVGNIAIDGKTMRGSGDDCKKALHIVSAWFKETGLVLGQVKTDDKSNEIKAIPALLEMLDITGCIVTIDAMGTQKDIAKKITVDKEADYVLALKQNHPLLFEEVSRYFENRLIDNTVDNPALLHYKDFDKGHGRIEHRNYYQTSDINWLTVKDEWSGLKSIGMVKYTSEKKGIKKSETRYFLCSIDNNIEKFANAVRGHWGIESMHWQLDVAFNEDAKKVRKDHAPENLSILHKVALNILKLDNSPKRMSLKKKRKKAGWNLEFLVKLFSNCIPEAEE